MLPLFKGLQYVATNTSIDLGYGHIPVNYIIRPHSTSIIALSLDTEVGKATSGMDFDCLTNLEGAAMGREYFCRVVARTWKAATPR